MTNDTLSPENGVTYNNIDANDSREKLEADIRKCITSVGRTLVYPDSMNRTVEFVSTTFECVIEWLDRQAAITERECTESGMTLHGGAEKIRRLKTSNEKVKEQNRKLRKERTELRDKVEELRAKTIRDLRSQYESGRTSAYEQQQRIDELEHTLLVHQDWFRLRDDLIRDLWRDIVHDHIYTHEQMSRLRARIDALGIEVD